MTPNTNFIVHDDETVKDSGQEGAPPLTCCATVGKSLHLTKSQFPSA